MRKRVLVLEPGGMRVAFNAGVLVGAGFKPADFDAIFVTSSAATLAALWKSGRDILTPWTTVFTHPDVFNWWNPVTQLTWPGNPEALVSLLSETGRPYHVAALDIPKPVIHVGLFSLSDAETIHVSLSRLNFTDLLKAAGAMPLITPPVYIQGNGYVDGGSEKPIAIVDAWKQLGEANVDFTFIGNRPLGWVHPEMNPLLVWLAFPFRPKARARVLRRPRHHAEAMAFITQPPKGATVRIIAPETSIGIERWERDPAKVQAVINLGLETGRAYAAKLKAGMERPTQSPGKGAPVPNHFV